MSLDWLMPGRELIGTTGKALFRPPASAKSKERPASKPERHNAAIAAQHGLPIFLGLKMRNPVEVEVTKNYYALPTNDFLELMQTQCLTYANTTLF